MQLLQIPENIKPFVKDIFFIESKEHNKSHSYPFYADGFPGIIYANPSNPFYLKPRNKELSDFYLYGQTIEPISLDTVGAFQMIVMRLYPFTVRILLDINPKVLNDDCFNLFDVKGIDTHFTFNKLRQTNDKNKIVNILADYFYELMENTLIRIDNRIQLAINFILNSN
jgi:hypothetical protein